MKNNKLYIIIAVITVILCAAVIISLKSAAGKRIDNAPTYSQSGEILSENKSG